MLEYTKSISKDRLSISILDQSGLGSVLCDAGSLGNFAPMQCTKADRFEIGPFLFSKTRVRLLIFILQYLKYLKSSTNLIILKLKPKDKTASALLNTS